MIIYTSSAKDLGKQIAKIRKSAAISQTKLAKEAKCDVVTISRWERWLSNPTIDTFLGIVKVLNRIMGDNITLSLKIKNDKAINGADSE